MRWLVKEKVRAFKALKETRLVSFVGPCLDAPFCPLSIDERLSRENRTQSR